MSDVRTNRYLEGLYAPVDVERTDLDLQVTGTLPVELDGRYLRIGPNPLGEVDPATYHWFTGDGMVHGIRLQDGQARWYRNRWVRSDSLAARLGEAPPAGEIHAGMDVVNTNVIGHAGRTFAVVEAGSRPVELTDELETVGRTDLDGTLPHGYSAHPKRDPRTGELHAVSYYWGRPELLEYTVIGTDGRVRRRVDVPVPGNPMVHDCALTESFIALLDLPVTFNLEHAMAGGTFPYTWDDEYGARLGLLPLEAGADDVEWYDLDPCFVFHPLNAYDDGDDVVLEVVRHPRMFDRNRLGPNEGSPTLWRWTVDRAAGRVREEQLDDRPIEFPRVDERLVGRRHRFGWAAHLSVEDDDLEFGPNGLIRYDHQTGRSEEISFGPGTTPGEAVFVPRSDGAAEDDGWYLTFVHDRATDLSSLAVLDASAPGEGPVATVHLPARVPLGFHGNWVPTA